jgi:NAD(P)-dependent dehydrogenase (short-subunit alcohol dehydrogenase family)
MTGKSEIRFDGRVAIVTGAGNGLGRDYAKALALRGAKVVVNDFGTDVKGNPVAGQAPADQVVSEIVDAGGIAVASKVNCATRDGSGALIDAAMSEFGRLDALVHNAGFIRNSPFEAMTDEQFDAVLEVHLGGAFHLAQAAFRVMRPKQYGRVVLIGSAAGLFGGMWQANYTAAKAGVVGLMNDVAHEGADHGILVNTVFPMALTRLGLEADDWPPDFFASQPEGWQSVIQVPYHGRDFVAPMVVWLASERCQSTQHIYSVSGGRFARVFTGVSQGWMSNFPEASSPEDIEANIGRIDDISAFTTPRNMQSEISDVVVAQRRALAERQKAS